MYSPYIYNLSYSANICQVAKYAFSPTRVFVEHIYKTHWNYDEIWPYRNIYYIRQKIHRIVRRMTIYFDDIEISLTCIFHLSTTVGKTLTLIILLSIYEKIIINIIYYYIIITIYIWNFFITPILLLYTYYCANVTIMSVIVHFNQYILLKRM